MQYCIFHALPINATRGATHHVAPVPLCAARVQWSDGSLTASALLAGSVGIRADGRGQRTPDVVHGRRVRPFPGAALAAGEYTEPDSPRLYVCVRVRVRVWTDSKTEVTGSHREHFPRELRLICGTSIMKMIRIL